MLKGKQLGNYNTCACRCCRVNWRPAKGSVTLKTGDVISCAGKGRLEIGEVSETKKGKFAVELQRRV